MTVVVEVKVSDEIERTKKEVIESHGRFLSFRQEGDFI